MSVQRRFDRQYRKWLLRSQLTGADKRWTAAMAYALAEIENLQPTMTQRTGGQGRSLRAPNRRTQTQEGAKYA